MNHEPVDSVSIPSLLDAAVKFSAQGHPEKAEQIYRQLLEIDPGNIAVLTGYGILCRAQKRLEEAISLYQSALAIEPDSPAVNRNLGNAYYDLQQFDFACRHMRLALTANPSNLPLAVRLCDAGIYSDNQADALYAARLLVEQAPEVHSTAALNRLGWVLMHCRRLEEARTAFTESLHLDPGNQGTRHLTEVLNGSQPPRPDPDVIRGSYQNAAAEYDKVIVKQLQNRTPQLLRSLLACLPSTDLNFSLALDLACGTGLMGVQIRSLVRMLVGVDLSPEMVALARRKNIYDRLEVEDLVAFINGGATDYDLFCCSDALIHLGDLAPLVDAVSRHSNPGSLFLFSTELTDDGDYQLDPSSYRYRHNPGYVKGLLAKHGFDLIRYEDADIRMDRGTAVSGGLYLAAKQ